MTWRDNLVNSSLENKKSSTKLGRILKVTQKTNINPIFNYPVQGTAAEGFKLALVYLDTSLTGKDADIVHNLHDEIFVEAKADIAEEVAAVVQKCMIKAFADILPIVPFVVKSKIQDSWG